MLNNRAKLAAQLGLMLAFWSILSLILFFVGETTINARTGVHAHENSPRTIQFAGLEWEVKSGSGLGPGPNEWSDSEESVWVDSEGQLHLKIRQIEGVWHAAEASTTTCTKYGMHRFYLIGRVDLLDKNVVAAPFLYKDDQHEIDIEFAKWGQDNPSNNGQYVVQPYSKTENIEKFLITLNGTHSTHYINWQASSIEFKSFHGHSPEPATAGHLIHEWLYTGEDNPSETECMKIHINLWLFQGNPPTNSQEVEIIVAGVDTPHYVYLPIVQKPDPFAPWITLMATGSNVSGEVGPAQYCTSDYKVALYAKTDIWYVQPSVTSSDISINSNCTWQSSANAWDELAAHLVTKDFSQPSTIGGPPVPSCPPIEKTDPDVMATACFQ
ncbi:MAG: hypothetical protein DWQ04_00560 [Chloroflexi bacterium]|nr:MAG: hypothetical protein DWQ04_00560 [Chloroflexota bacterium]